MTAVYNKAQQLLNPRHAPSSIPLGVAFQSPLEKKKPSDSDKKRGIHTLKKETDSDSDEKESETKENPENKDGPPPTESLPDLTANENWYMTYLQRDDKFRLSNYFPGDNLSFFSLREYMHALKLNEKNDKETERKLLGVCEDWERKIQKVAR